MPIHRRKVYFDYSLGRKRRMEEWFSYSIFVSVAILILCLLASLPDMMSRTVAWVMPRSFVERIGSASEVEHFLAAICEFLAVISGAYLALALFIRSIASQGQR